MLGTTLAEGRNLGPSSGSYLQHCCDKIANNNHQPGSNSQNSNNGDNSVESNNQCKTLTSNSRKNSNICYQRVSSDSVKNAPNKLAQLSNNHHRTTKRSSLWSPITPSLPPIPVPLPPPFLPPLDLHSSIHTQLPAESTHFKGTSASTLKIQSSTEVTESLFATGGYNTPPTSSPFLPVTPFDLVAKNFHPSASIAYSQANSIFVQSQTDYLSGITSSVSKKTETCFGRWEQTTLEPLHIQVPPLQPVTNLTIKTESISCDSANNSGHFDEYTSHSNSQQGNHHHSQQTANQSLHYSHSTRAHSDVGGNNCSGLVTTMTTSSPSTTCLPSSNDFSNGCSRTIPVSWSASSSSSSVSSASAAPSSTSNLLGIGGSSSSSPYSDNQSHLHLPSSTHQSQHHAGSSSSAISSSSSCTLLQIKREPCQVSEVTTSNNLGHQQNNRNSTALSAVIKIESSSPKSTVMENHTISAPQNSAGAIPVGIAVARQRLQEHATMSHQPKEVNRFGIGISDIGGATSSLSQNMFFAGTNSTMIPLTSDALTMGVSNVQNAVRTPPALWQYPTPMPVESMLPMPIPPVGFQLVRDPGTGQFLFLPTAATIEPFQQAVVWPSYQQTATAIQPQHLLLPPIAQSIQPPPLAPLQLLGSDYLTTASTTLHQHTQTHSTRLVALTSDTKRKSTSGPAIPLPIPHHAVIKIEDCSSGSTTTTGGGTTTAHHHHHHQSAIFGEDKANSALHASASTITTAVQTNDIPTQLYYHQPSSGLIQIASHHSQPNSLSSSLQECRSIANESPPPLALPSVSINSPAQVPTCLTPPPEQIVPENLEAATSCVPEVQDATIQTDTPIMSEDDNTLGAEECSSLSPAVCANEEDGRDIGIPSSTSLGDAYNSVTNNIAVQSDEGPHDYTQKAMKQQQEQAQLDQTILENEISKNDSGFESNAVTSTNSIEEPTNITEQSWENQSNNLESEELVSNASCEAATTAEEPLIKEVQKITSTPVDLSGLELLSNISIEAIEKKVDFIKQEPIEERYEPEPCTLRTIPEEKGAIDNFTDQGEQLGGLNLLCALAEQRIQEEVGKRCRKRSSSSSDSHGSKKKKHKHSSGKKSSKKSKHEKDKKERKRRRHSEEAETEREPETRENGDLDTDLKETLNRVKAKFAKCSSCKREEGTGHCCRENWPTPEELINAMETDMRLRLADITRQCQEKKRELEEIAPILQQRKIQLTADCEPSPVVTKSSCSKASTTEKLITPIKLSSIASMSPNVSSESHLGIDIPKISSDTESSKFEDVETSSSSSSKRKGGNPKKNDDGNTETIVAKKPKSLVGYILASKNRLNENVKEKNVFDSPGFFTDDASVFSESSCKLRASAFKTEPTIKQEVFEDDSLKPGTETFSPVSDSSYFSPDKKYHRKSSKHHSKHKKSKSNKERRHRSSELKEKKKKIDARCILKAEHLDKEKTRVLTAMGGLFYAGCLSPLQPPDVYAVTLDGERGNRPHIMSREEVLRDAILEVLPVSVDEIYPGARLCAYWSQQYRCLYPGTAAEPGTPDSINDKKFVSVEFDDGDSGKIAIEDIRFLLSDYPIVEYDPNPLLSLGKRKRRTSQSQVDTLPQKTGQISVPSTNCFGIGLEDSKSISKNLDKETYRERRRLKKLRKDKLKRLEVETVEGSSVERKHKHKHKCGDEFCKNRKHKKRRKHKKHHHRETIVTPPLENSQDVDSSQDASIPCDEYSVEHDDSVSQNGETLEGEGEPVLKDTKEKTKFDADIKEDTMTEEEAESSITESSGSIYEPGKKKERQNSADNHSKIAAFLPARQLWGWQGKGYRRAGAKGRAKKQFYKTIQRGKEAITIGDSAVFLSTGRPDRPYIGRIESMWETSSSNKVVRVKWFYHPEETEGCPNLKFPGALFESPHEDENDVQTISHKCEVLPLQDYTNKFGMDPKQYESIYDNNDTYYLAGYYDPTALNLKLKPEIPILAANDKWVQDKKN